MDGRGMEDNPNHWKRLIIEAQTLVWIDDKDNWARWEKGMGWWRKLRARLFVTGKHNPNPKPNGPIMGPGKPRP